MSAVLREVAKVNFPHPDKRSGVRAQYDAEFSSQQAMDAGGLGLVFGRNIWQRPYDESMRFVATLMEILAEHPSTRAPEQLLSLSCDNFGVVVRCCELRR